MKRLGLSFALIFISGVIAFCMKPGPPLVVNCPDCGAQKKLMSIVSGNTFGARLWSDGMMFAPMLPRISPVQKCPECGNFFILTDSMLEYGNPEETVTDTGQLSYNDVKQALQQLNDSSLTKDDEFVLRREFLFRYNDAFRDLDKVNDDVEKTRTARDKTLHQENLLALVRLSDRFTPYEIPVIAEYLREAGLFEECLEILKDYTPDDDSFAKLVSDIYEKASALDSTVFEIELR